MTDLDGNDALLQLLSESWDQQQCQSVETSKWTRDYLTRLTSLPLDELLREPDELRVEQEKMRRDAQQLAFNDYPAFIHANNCRQQVDSTLDDLQDQLTDFLDAVPGLYDACQVFGQSSQKIADERSKITHVLEHQSVLVDLLEIPQLMETCVWNGYYSEAMDLASHVRLLLVRYPLPIVRSIQQQVQASADLMLVQLVQHLRQPIKLAAAMNVIGHLRRMDVFESEMELRMVFLRCRHDYLTQRLDRIKTRKEDVGAQEAFEYMKRYIDVMREQMFEIATQYMSVFSHQEQQSILILSDYMVRLISEHFQTTLQAQLAKITDTSSLASLLTQIQYCGMSLGRIGLDFRHLFVSAFEDTLRPLILKWIDQATEQLIAAISTDKSWMSASSTRTTQDDDDYSRHPNQPPMLLVNYPPLAIYTNAILSAFNALRLLPAVSLQRPIQSHLDGCFMEIGGALKQYTNDNSDAMVRSFVLAYVRCCVPFLKSCLLDVIYANIQLPESAISNKDLEELLGVKADDHLADESSETKEQNEDTEQKTDEPSEDTEQKTDEPSEDTEEKVDEPSEDTEEKVDEPSEDTEQKVDEDNEGKKEEKKPAEQVNDEEEKPSNEEGKEDIPKSESKKSDPEHTDSNPEKKNKAADA